MNGITLNSLRKYRNIHRNGILKEQASNNNLDVINFHINMIRQISVQIIDFQEALTKVYNHS